MYVHIHMYTYYMDVELLKMTSVLRLISRQTS